jgi:hypothetical protein
MFRESYYSAVAGTAMRQDLIDNITDEAHVSGYIGHIGHCFDYVRQSILCAGDMTPERINTRSPRNGELIGVHQCKDWQRVIEWI